VRDLLREYSGSAIRAMLLGHHYREEWEYREAEMRQADKLMGKLVSAARLVTSQNNPSTEAMGADEVAQRAQADVTEALNDDLDTPRALRALEALADTALGSGAEGQLTMLTQLAKVLGLRAVPTVSAGTSVMTGGVAASSEL
jgi:L-cysteine:1D-myo-inositol 2-amino-2-deoxy-alpha-D-glucopyranoside ligase